MSLFSDTVDKVYSITNRPDLVAETALSVRLATLSAHRSDFYPRDLAEISISFSPAEAIYQLSIDSYFPLWRSFAYIRPYDTSPANFLLTFLPPDSIFDEYLLEKTNVAYVAGTNLNIKLAAAYGNFLVGYYKNPVLSPDSAYDSWIAKDHDAIIVLEAAQRVLAMIGYEEAAARLRRLLYEPAPDGLPSEFNRFRASNLESQGR